MSTQHPRPGAPATGPAALLGLMWIAVWGFSGFFLSYSTMVPISLQRGLSSVTGGALLMVMMISVIGIQPAAPALQRLIGPRRALGAALVLMALGHASALLVAHPVAGLLLTGLTVGCGFGILVVLATAAVPAVTSPERAGRALGLFGATTSAAAAVGAPLGLWLSGQVPLEVFRIVAAGAVLLSLLALPGVPARVPQAPEPTAPGRPDGVPPVGRAGAARASGPSWTALIPVLLPFLVAMAAYGLVIAFGPGDQAANVALFIAVMQGAAVLGRWLAGTLTDRREPAAVYTVGIVLTVLGLVLVAVMPPGWALAASLALLGLGVGAIQSASLVMAFARARSRGQASVGWNMSFDIGLGLAGVFGGLGFTYLGPGPTFTVIAGVLLAAGIPLWLRRR